jgi:predicted TIM-barrel fold metal-dependent hydrolase
MPGVVSQANDELANAIAPYPDRFRGFCFLPMAQPVAAADELERCISQLGFVGALVDSHLLNDTFYDSPNFDPLWATLERLEVPIYLHPTYPRIQEVNGTGGLYTPDNKVYSEPIASVLGTAGWGWHSDCGLQFLRLWLAGVFDRYPGLKVVLGHMGEMLPYMLARTDFVLGATKPAGATIPETYAKNIWVTTSGFFSLDPFSTLLRTTSVDRIMVSNMLYGCEVRISKVLRS